MTAPAPSDEYAAMRLAVSIVAAALAADAALASPRLGPETQRPVPRYESIADAKAYGRRGPSAEHRIDWVYRARGLPVQVLEESGPWRRVKDPDGGEVWMHAAMLSQARTVFVRGAERLPLRAAPRPEARVVAWLERGVVATLKGCLGGWRRVSIDDRAAGWIAADGLWAGEDCPATD